MRRSPDWPVLGCLVLVLLIWGGAWAVLGYTAARLIAPTLEVTNHRNGPPTVAPGRPTLMGR